MICKWLGLEGRKSETTELRFSIPCANISHEKIHQVCDRKAEIRRKCKRVVCNCFSLSIRFNSLVIAMELEERGGDEL